MLQGGFGRRLVATAAGAVVALAGALLVPVGAAADAYAPLDQAGPPLSVDPQTLRDALRCSGDPTAGPAPVLLVHGTALDSRVSFDFGWVRTLNAAGRSHCELDLAEQGMADIQTSAEHVVYAIREVHRRAGRPIDVVGHSQGGMVPRWALRFWPDTRPMVDDLVGIAASNHGTVAAQFVCAGRRCAPSIWQQRSDSAFVAALNSRTETFPEVDYTALYTRLDEVVVPNLDDSGSTSLRGGGANVANVAVQDVCPVALVEHLGVGTYDATAYAIALDALDNAGPARLERVDRAVCTRALMPGIDPLTFPADFAAIGAKVAEEVATAAQSGAEPALRCYVTAACPRAAVAAARLTRRCVRGRLRVRLESEAARGVDFKLGRRLVRRDRGAPFETLMSPRTLTRGSGSRLRAVVRLDDGRQVLSRTLPRCSRR